MIRTVIIDDEPSALNVLSIMLKKKCTGRVEVVGSTNDPLEGIRLIRELSPDLVFLDIEMPGMTGIDLVRSIPDATCRVIFVTAYDAYAVQAFRLSAVDYLLKPVEGDDLVAAVSKIESDILSNRNTYHDQLKALKDMLQRTNSDHKIGIGMSDKILFVSVSDIMYCEASGSYTHIFLADGHRLVASKTLGDFETQLATFGFFRIHHSYLINLNKIREYQRHDGGYVVMQNGKSLEISQRKRKDFLEAITNSVI